VDKDLACTTIDSAGAALAAAGRGAPDAPVPSCPGWTVLTVIRHVGQVHRWAARMLREYPEERLAFEPADDISDADVVQWADAQRAELTAALAASDGDRLAWAFGTMLPARFWWRRQSIETALHAWDASDGAGAAWAIPPEVGVEGVDEFFEWIFARVLARKASAWGEGRTVHLHRTDGDGEWLVMIGNPPTVSHGHAKGDLAVRGAAADLLRWTTNRRADVELFGDTALAEAWAANVAF